MGVRICAALLLGVVATVVATQTNSAVAHLDPMSLPSLGESSKETWGFGGITTFGSFNLVLPSFEKEESLGDSLGRRRRRKGKRRRRKSSPPPPPTESPTFNPTGNPTLPPPTESPTFNPTGNPTSPPPPTPNPTPNPTGNPTPPPTANEQSCSSWYSTTMSTSGSENCLFYSAAADKCLDESWKNNKWGDHDFMKDGKPRSITKNVGSSSVISETFGVLKVSGSDENKARKGIVYLRKSECDFESTGTGDCVLSSKILCLEMDEEQVLHEFGKFFFGGNCDVIKNCGLDSAFRPFVPLA